MWGREAKGQLCQPAESNVAEEGKKVIEPVCVGEWLSFAAFLPGQWWVSNMEVLSLVAKVVAR